MAVNSVSQYITGSVIREENATNSQGYYASVNTSDIIAAGMQQFSRETGGQDSPLGNTARTWGRFVERRTLTSCLSEVKALRLGLAVLLRKLKKIHK